MDHTLRLDERNNDDKTPLEVEKEMSNLTAVSLLVEYGRADIGDMTINDEPDEDKLNYCTCNGISYGTMVACDGAECQREWFRLECVGLKHEPKGSGT